ncbi:protein of unknown function [Maridesulfovibrio hydrothermalis AM13 = DSM 14728]|uniref:Uncharacterized protein n=2 Tax=Maridesulfovibrio TaxID=2794998 RepID=L0R6H7_9BACT|nr:protein of unknown function [Maridesulfovibrio hydrothermalis AM13 = DSM 14728]
MPATGHSAVLGTAGNGKTTLALYRAAYLSKPSMPYAGKVVTFIEENGELRFSIEGRVLSKSYRM